MTVEQQRDMFEDALRKIAVGGLQAGAAPHLLAQLARNTLRSAAEQNTESRPE